MNTLYVKRKCMIYVLLLLPFFELYSLEMFAAKGVFPAVIKVITTLCSLGRIGITGYLVCDYLYRRRLPSLITTWGMGLFCLSCITASFLNGSLYLQYIVGNITYIGLALLCEKMMRNSVEDFHKACLILFGFYSMIGAVTIYLFPNGFFNAATKAEAVYFLGSKNSSFFYFMILLFFYYYESQRKKGRLPKFGGIVCIALLFAVKICDSSSSLMCLLLILAGYLVIKYGQRFYKFLNAKLLFVFCILLTLFIIFSANHVVIKTIVEMVGRNTSYSGRDKLWEQAMEMFMENPFIGNGIFSEFQLATGVWATHAHDVYLDWLAKFGIFPLVIFLVTTLMILHKCAKSKNKKMVNLIGIFLFVLYLHNIFDDVSMYIVVLLFAGFEDLKFAESQERKIIC